MDPRTIRALRDLDRGLSGNGFPYFLLGGCTSEIALRIASGGERPRPSGSEDIDVAFRPSSWKEFDRAVEFLKENDFFEADREQLLFHRNGSRVDLWPFGEGIAPGRRLVWRRSGAEISTIGLEWARIHARFEEVAKDLRVLLPPVPLVVFVKVVFYLSRLAGRDLADVVYCLENYAPDSPAVPPGAGNRTGDSSPEAGAFRLGQDLRRFLPESGLRVVVKFLEEVRVVHAPLISRVLREREIPISEGERMERLFRLFAALRRGVKLPGEWDPASHPY